MTIVADRLPFSSDNQSMTHRTPYRFLLIASFALLLHSGCGKGRYNQRMEDSKASLSETTEYYELLQPEFSNTYARDDSSEEGESELPTGVRLQFPKVFGDDSPQDRRSLNYLAGALPSLAKARLEFVDQEGRTKVPMVAWILRFPLSVLDVQAVAKAEEVARLFLENRGLPEWENDSVSIFRRGEGIVSVPLRRLTLECEQRYPGYREESPELNLAGRTEIYLVPFGDQFVVAVWSAPDSIADSRFFEAAALATATIKVPPVTPPEDSEEEPEDE